MVNLNERYHGAGETDIEIIDTKAERRKNGMTGNFSRKLLQMRQLLLGDSGQTRIELLQVGCDDGFGRIGMQISHRASERFQHRVAVTEEFLQFIGTQLAL